MTPDPSDIPDSVLKAFAEASDWFAELREEDPEWKPPDPYDVAVMREDPAPSVAAIAGESDASRFAIQDGRGGVVWLYGTCLRRRAGCIFRRGAGPQGKIEAL